MNQPWVYMCSPSWTPSQLLPHPIPQGHPSAPALSALINALNLDWRSVSHMIIYIFQCYSLKSSHPRILPLSPKDCSIHLSLLLSRIQGCHYHLSKFHIYALVYCIGVFLFGLLLVWCFQHPCYVWFQWCFVSSIFFFSFAFCCAL